MKLIEGAKSIGLRLGVLEAVSEPTAQLPPPVVQPKAPDKPQAPKEVVKESLVQPLQIREIEHDVTLDGVTYNCRVARLDFNSKYTCGDVTIVHSQRWQVKCRVLLTWDGRPNDCDRDFVAAFANAGLMVSHKLISACLFPLQMQVLQIERRLDSFG